MASGWVRPQNNTAPLTQSCQVITEANNARPATSFGTSLQPGLLASASHTQSFQTITEANFRPRITSNARQETHDKQSPFWDKSAAGIGNKRISDASSKLVHLVAAVASGWVRPQNNTAPLTQSCQVITEANNARPATPFGTLWDKFTARIACKRISHTELPNHHRSQLPPSHYKQRKTRNARQAIPLLGQICSRDW